MSDWIIEADIYRLEKALSEAVYDEERSRLSLLLERKRKLLSGAPAFRASSQPEASVPVKAVLRGRRNRTPLALL